MDSILSGAVYDGPAFTTAYFINQKQIEPFMSQFPLEKLRLFGQEGFLALNEKQVLSYPKEEQERWIRTAKRLLDVPEYLALAEHIMYIGRKMQ